MSINRIHKTEQFVQIPNETLRDKRLSFRARGILAYMLTHSDGWRAGYRDLAEAGKEGREAVMSALRELEDAGYREVVRKRRGDGTFHTEIHWYDTPVNRGTGTRSTASPTV